MTRGGKGKGRPAGRMTHNRRAVLREIAEASARGEQIALAELARRCGLHNYQKARRTLRDIRRYGLEAVEA